MTKGKGSVVKSVTFEEEQTSSDVPFDEQVWDFIANCGEDGALLSEIYAEFPASSDRHVRYKIKEFTIKNMLDTDHTCRCGRSTIYIAKSYKKSKALVKPNRKNIHNKIVKDSDVKQIRKKSTKKRLV